MSLIQDKLSGKQRSSFAFTHISLITYIYVLNLSGFKVKTEGSTIWRH